MLRTNIRREHEHFNGAYRCLRIYGAVFTRFPRLKSLQMKRLFPTGAVCRVELLQRYFGLKV